jgi:hypothetical protein
MARARDGDGVRLAPPDMIVVGAAATVDWFGGRPTA